MSSFGTLFKVTTYGESHCKSVSRLLPVTLALD